LYRVVASAGGLGKERTKSKKKKTYFCKRMHSTFVPWGGRRTQKITSGKGGGRNLFDREEGQRKKDLGANTGRARGGQKEKTKEKRGGGWGFWNFETQTLAPDRL